jgi:hypothetical protein
VNIPGFTFTYRLRKFSSEKGSASLETFLTLDLPRATMREGEDGEASDERGDEGGPCAFTSDPPFSSVGSVGMVILSFVLLLRLAYGQPQKIDQVVKKYRIWSVVSTGLSWTDRVDLSRTTARLKSNY